MFNNLLSLAYIDTGEKGGGDGGKGSLKRNIRGRQRGMRWSDIWEGKAQERKLKA